MTLLILAAGLGSRYGGLKQLDPINDFGEFIIDYSVFDAKRAGFDRVVFVIKEENFEFFKETIGSRIEGHIKVDYCFQKMDNIPSWAKVPEGRTKPWGTTHAVLAAKEIVKDNFAVLNADDFYGFDTFKKVAAHLKKENIDGPIPEYCMVGFVLNNTLTDHGSVSRGVCMHNNGMLSNIVERTKIFRTSTGPVFEEDGVQTPLDNDTVVSMNFWGFTPAIFEQLEKQFENFLKVELNENPLKKECLLPNEIGNLLDNDACKVRVYSTESVWFGVTYKEDRESVVKSIGALTDGVTYPKGLWK